jgi:hypothetical protein
LPPTPRKIRVTIANARASIDLASVMVGVIVIGVISGIISVAVFAVIPWAQDEAAKSNIQSVSIAQGVAHAQDGTFLPSQTLIANEWLESSDTVVSGTDDAGSCYVGVARSDSNKLFFGTDVDQEIGNLERTTDPGCVDSDELAKMVDQVGGWGDTGAALAEFENYDFPNAARDVFYEETPKRTSDGKSVTSVSKGDLPTGLSIDGSKGTVSGIPTAAGEKTFTLTATSPGGSVHREYSITVGPVPPKITTGTLPDGTKGAQYESAVAFTGDEVVLTESLGKMPAGVLIDSATGAITGVPEETGTFVFTISAMNASGVSAQAYSITIGLIAPKILNGTLPDGTKGAAYESAVRFTGEGVHLTESLGKLPAGLLIDSTSGAITGIPSAAGTFNFTITAMNAGGLSAQAYSINIGVVAPKILNGTLPDGTKGTAYESAVEFTGEGVFLTESLGKLPAGLQLNSATGAIAGTPTEAATFDFTISAMNAGGVSAQAYSITVKHTAPTITRSALPNAMRDDTYAQTLTWTGDDVRLSKSLGTLPTGLALDATTGKISGTATEAGHFDFTITAANSGGTSAQAYRVTISLTPPTITASYLSGAAVGSDYRAALGWAGKSVTLTTTALPDGLSLNSTTGVISGVPTTAGTQTFTVTATNFGGTAAATYSITTLTPKNLAANGSFEIGQSTSTIVDENLSLNPDTRTTGTLGSVANDSTIHAVYVEADTGTAPPGQPALSSGVVSSVTAGKTSNSVLSLYNVDGRGDLATARKTGAWLFVVGSGYVARSGSTGPATDVPSGTWTYIVASTAEAGYSGATVYAWKKDGSNAAASDSAILTGITTLSGPAAPSKTLSFSGATASTAEAQYAWTGAANASTSVRKVVAPTGVQGGAAVVSQSSAWAKSGSKSLRVASRYASRGSAYADLEVGTAALSAAAVAGKTYTMIATAKTFESRPVAMTIAEVTVTKAGTVESAFSSAPNIVGEQELRVTFTIPANADVVMFRAYNLGAAGDADVWFDNVAIVEGIYTGPYIP